MQRLVWLFLLISLCVRAQVTIQDAQLSDLDEIMALDRKVSFEYFQPLFKQQYPHLVLGQQADQLLEEDLVFDYAKFQKSLSAQTDQNRLLVAKDSDQEKVVGFLQFHIQPAYGVFDLLMVDKEYRRQKIGQQLLAAALYKFPAV